MALPENRGRALITGASSGLGRALAFRCARMGWDLLLVARREKELRDLAIAITAESSTEVNVAVIPLDLCVPGAIRSLESQLAGRNIRLEEITLLVNNAGIGDYGPFLESEPDRLQQAITLNVQVPTELTRRLAPAMKPGGAICMIASVAAFSPGPLMATYYATKAYLLSLGEALHEELRPRGLRVTVACPGPFHSAFHAAAGIGAIERLPSADRIAKAILKAVHSGRVVAPIGAGPLVWALIGPRLPRFPVRRMVHCVQRRRRKYTQPC